MGQQSASAERGAIVLPVAICVVHMHTVQEQLGFLLIAAIAADCCKEDLRSRGRGGLRVRTDSCFTSLRTVRAAR